MIYAFHSPLTFHNIIPLSTCYPASSSSCISSPLNLNTATSSPHLINLPTTHHLLPSYSTVSQASSTNSSALVDKTHDVVVVGAGIAGLAAARTIQDHLRSSSSPDPIDFHVIEASDQVGGRIRSDLLDGFILDRGFQVFIEAYPEQKSILDYNELELQPFLPGAVVHTKQGFHLVSDPFRRPQDIFKSLLSPVGTIQDKIRVALLRLKIQTTDVSNIDLLPEKKTIDFLREDAGFSSSIIDQFFKPFYQGIFLADLSKQSSRMFQFVFRMFLEAGTSLPKRGIGQVTAQLAQSLPQHLIHLNTPCVKIDSHTQGYVLTLKNGKTVYTKSVIVAVDPPACSKLLTDADLKYPEGRGSTCLYFSSNSQPPIKEPILMLNGETTNTGVLVNNMFFPASVSSAYAPPGKTLVSVTIIGCPSDSDTQLEAKVKAELRQWFDPNQVDDWKLLRVYKIPYSQPEQTPPNKSFIKDQEVKPGLFLCGDHMNTATVNGAISSGKVAAERVIQHLRK